MRNKVISIKGINRNVVSPENDVGFCSELINLKDENGIKVVSNKEVVSANIPYINIRMHRINTKINYIGIKDDATGVDVVHFNPSSGEEIVIKHFPVGSEVYFTFLNDQIVISDKTAIKVYVYKFDNTAYKPIPNGLDISISTTFSADFYDYDEAYSEYAPSKAEYLSALRAHVNKFKVENKNYCEGTFLYAFSVTLSDGTETGMFDLTPVTTAWTIRPTEENAFISVAENNGSASNTIYTRYYFNRFYQKITLKIPAVDTDSEPFKSLIGAVSKVNLYVSAPITRMPIVEENVIFDAPWEDGKVNTFSFPFSFDAVMTDESGVEKTLLYKQKSWPLEDFFKGDEYDIEFGGDKQTTGATMEVSASSIDRAGKMYTYNNRVHFFDSVVRLKDNGLGNLKWNATGETVEGYETIQGEVYVFLKTVNKDNVIKYSNVEITKVSNASPLQIVLPDMIVYSDSRAYKMRIIVNDRYLDISLFPSPAYNYAYAFGEVDKKYDTKEFDGTYPELSNTYTETNIINVTAGGQPVVFPVDYSYRFDGNIRAISVAISPISDTQVGQYPLDVFTDNGIYALQQGSGAVLYSSIVPISDDVCENREVVPTRYGILYIAHNSLYLLEGRKATKLSLLLEGEVDTYIQNNESFIKCCGGSLYDITAHLSVVEFREYIKGATLVWCTNTNEVIVSNKDYNYSYVYDFIFNSWHKVSGIYERVEDNIVSKPITINTDGATPAKGTITLSAIHSEQSKTFSSLCSATYDTTYSCGPGHTIALLVNGTQVASATFSQTTRMPMIVATLCEKISYLEDTIGMIYSKADLSGQTVEIYNTSMQTTMSSSSFVASSQSVTIPDKAIGATVTVTIAGIIFSAPFTSSSSVVTLMSEIADKINASTSCPVNAMLTRNIITLTAKNTGLITNNIKISAVSSDDNYIYISTDNPTLTGGKDISLEPSDYRELIDWSKETQGGQTKVHLHTRPLCLDNPNGYKTLKRTMLNCLCELTGEQNLSLYIYGSNNLVDWKCICAAQRQNCTIAQITADRAAKAYKYFIFMIGGIVNDNTQLSSLFTTLEDIAPNKLR